MSRRSWRLRTGLVAVCLAAPAATDATPEEDRQRALLLVDIGREAFQAGEHGKAFEAFSKAHAALPDQPALQWNLGRCKEKLGEVEEALDYFDRYLETESEDRDGLKEALDKVGELRARLRPDSATLRVETHPAGAAVRVDGEPVGESPAAVEVRPGEHAVEARLEGYEPASMQVTAEAGAGTNVSLVLSKIVVVRVPAAPPPPPPLVVRVWRPALASAVAVVATALSVHAFLERGDRLDDAEAFRARGPTEPRLAGRNEGLAKDLESRATVQPALGAGWASLAAGAFSLVAWELLRSDAPGP